MIAPALAIAGIVAAAVSILWGTYKAFQEYKKSITEGKSVTESLKNAVSEFFYQIVNFVTLGLLSDETKKKVKADFTRDIGALFDFIELSAAKVKEWKDLIYEKIGALFDFITLSAAKVKEWKDLISDKIGMIFDKVLDVLSPSNIADRLGAAIDDMVRIIQLVPIRLLKFMREKLPSFISNKLGIPTVQELEASEASITRPQGTFSEEQLQRQTTAREEQQRLNKNTRPDGSGAAVNVLQSNNQSSTTNQLLLSPQTRAGNSVAAMRAGTIRQY